MSERHVVHWDDVQAEEVDEHLLRASWADLGRAAGTVGVGLQRLGLRAGDRPTPPHVHGAEEEIFYVLAGAGLSWQDGTTYEVRAGDCLVHRRRREAHTLIAGPEGLDVLAFGQRQPVEACVLPRAGAAWLGPSWTEVGGPNPWARDAVAGPLEVPAPSLPRPSTVVALDEVPPREWGQGAHSVLDRDLGRAAGSEVTGLHHVTVAPGMRSAPHHCHSAEEELFVVLDGEGVLCLGDDEHPVRPGTVVARPPATRIAHSLRAGAGGLVYLAYGTREPNDIAYYPRSGKVSLRGVGVIGRLQPTTYWEGED